MMFAIAYKAPVWWGVTRTDHDEYPDGAFYKAPVWWGVTRTVGVVRGFGTRYKAPVWWGVIRARRNTYIQKEAIISCEWWPLFVL